MAEVDETTVESALAELREMPGFNRARVEFTESYDSKYGTSHKHGVVITLWRLHRRGVIFRGHSLNEAMDQFRAWREQQEARR